MASPSQNPQAGVNMNCLCPAKRLPARKDAVKMLNFFFDFMSNPQRQDKFEFWFELWKCYYYAIFYPKVCEAVGLVTPVRGKVPKTKE